MSAALGPAEGYIAKFCKCAYLLHKPQILISMTGTSRDTTSQALVHLDKLCYRWAETLDILWSTKGSGLLQIPALSSHTGGTRHPPAVHRCMQVNQTILDYFKRRKNTLCESTFRWFQVDFWLWNETEFSTFWMNKLKVSTLQSIFCSMF